VGTVVVEGVGSYEQDGREKDGRELSIGAVSMGSLNPCASGQQFSAPSTRIPYIYFMLEILGTVFMYR